VNAVMNLQVTLNVGNFLTSVASPEGLCSMELVCAVSEEGAENDFFWLTDTSLLIHALFIAHGNSDSGTVKALHSKLPFSDCLLCKVYFYTL
jgi:hypothetical protein